MNQYHLDYDLGHPVRGFSKSQILSLTYEDLEKLAIIENSEVPEKNKGEEDKHKKNPNDGGPRPPKEEDFPDEDPFPDVSNPNGKDN